ncbi:MAG: hypothetical protein GTO03_04040, partial [Planctomycetales bacterium]|nr:hypothetical protein [Planctomycetales bacterium]
VTYRNDHYDLLTWYADHESAAAVAAGFVEGQSYPIWYDPADPQRAVLVRGQSLTFWLLMLLPLAFLATGVGGLAYNVWQWAISRERRAAIAQLASSRERLDESGQVQPRLPAVPYDADVTNSPGTTLAYRLPIATLRGWRLFALTGACLAWNTLVAVLLWLACRNHLEGRPDWIMDVTTGVFAIPGLWLAYKLAEQLLYSSGIGMTRVEISQHPLEPGGRYEVYLSQGGRLAVKKLELMLICEEQATYRQGTDTVTDKRLVNIQPIWQKSDFRIQPPDMFETRCNFAVPSTAMHSFRSEHNAVTWKLVIRGDVERWAAYERDFPVVVVPNAQSDPPEVHGTTLAAAP